MDFLDKQSDRDKFPISKKDLVIQEVTIHRLLQYSNNLSISYKGTTRPQDDKQIDYYGTQRNDSQQPTTSFTKKVTSQPAVK